MAPTVLSRVLHGDSSIPTTHLTIIPAILHNYTRHKVLRADYPAIIPNTSDTDTRVRGSFVSGLTQMDLRNLDIFEGSEYERRTVTVNLLDEEGDLKCRGRVEGEAIECDTYVWVKGSEMLESGTWSFEEFVNEKMYRWAGDSDEYADLDSAVVDSEEEEGESGYDPTGGRGVDTDMDLKLKGKAREELIEAAV